MKTCQHTAVALMVILLGIGGCNAGKENESSLTFPTENPETSSPTMENFYATQSDGQGYCVYIAGGEFRFNALPGEYLLTYTTDLGMFKFVMRVLQEALVTIGIHPGDVMREAILYKGIITNTAMRAMQSVQVSGPVTLATWPGIEQEAIVLDPTEEPIRLILNGQINPEMKECRIPVVLPTPIPKPDLNVTLTWEENENLALLVIESVGGYASEGHQGVTALSTGDNMCGFGASCIPETCFSDLTCHEPERVYVPTGTAITGFYTIRVDAFGTLNPQNVVLKITTSNGTTTFTCAIPANGFKNIAEVTFPGGAIGNIADPGLCTVN